MTSISDIWNSPNGECGFISAFIQGLGAARELNDDESRMVGERLTKLASLRNYQFSALELSADMDIVDYVKERWG